MIAVESHEYRDAGEVCFGSIALVVEASTERRDSRKDEHFDLRACENWPFHNLASANPGAVSDDCDSPGSPSFREWDAARAERTTA
jgi:hypothetical protein